MKLKAIAFDDELEPKPATAVVELSLREVVLIARMIGPTTHTARNQIQSDGGEVGSDLYEGLKDIVYPFFEDGFDEVAR